MKLLIVIPAYNEEKSIESIIERSLNARKEIIAKTKVTSIEITVVSDGSTDHTVELASKYKEKIKIIVFDKNRGYGAAIKEAWKQSDADLLSFLDADGTCDPRFFINLCELMEDKKADVALGCRLNQNSKMPFIRKLGNIFFSLMLTLFSSKINRDTASGMRIVKRSCLPKLMPLPDGLHFTPAMSARAILSDDIKISEVNMPYHEREGESKLSALKDGLRFLKIILSTAFLYRPSRILTAAGVMGLFFASFLMIMPIIFYLRNHIVLEWMIYRFIVCNLLGIVSLLLLCSSYLSTKIVNITLSECATYSNTHKIFSKIFSNRFFWLIPIVLFLLGGLLVVPSFLELVKTGVTYEHWSRFIVMSFFYSVSFILIVTRLLDYFLFLITNRLNYLKTIK